MADQLLAHIDQPFDRAVDRVLDGYRRKLVKRHCRGERCADHKRLIDTVERVAHLLNHPARRDRQRRLPLDRADALVELADPVAGLVRPIGRGSQGEPFGRGTHRELGGYRCRSSGYQDAFVHAKVDSSTPTSKEQALRVAIAQCNPTIGDFAGNRARILNATRQARDHDAELVVFPELAVCGYPPMDLLDQRTFLEENQRSLRCLQRELPEDTAVAIGFVDANREADGKPLQNTVAVLHDGRVIHTQAKTLLPTYDVFDEARYFEPALARQPFTLHGVSVGIAICEDIWWETPPTPGERYPIDPVKELVDAGAELLLVPSASPFFAGKRAVREDLARRIANLNRLPVVYCNTVGGNDSLIFDGYSFAVAADGEVITRAPGFQEHVLVLDLTPARTDSPANELHPAAHPLVRGGTAPRPEDRYSDIEAALVLGIRDYLAKSGFTRVHFGLSGGIDSAVVAVLAVHAVGRENVHAFLLPSHYSSAGSITDSEELCRNLGVEYTELAIEDIYRSFTDKLEPVFAGCEPDLTEENIQARVRGTLLMAYSNKFSSLVLTTGNKSELATGYCTLYGDMAGALAVIGDLFKTEVYELAEALNRDREIIPPSIIAKPPSAELRSNQTDQDSLPPYDELDAVLYCYIIENLTSTQIIDRGFSHELVDQTLRLVARAEYKRRQTPPVLKVSPRAFGTGRRVPIARSIYENSS